MPGFPGNALAMDYFRKIPNHSVIAGAATVDFNVTAVRPHRGAIYSEVNEVDQASVSYVDR